MTWRRIALKNLLKNVRRYIGYLSSASLAVMVFFMFANFTMNPTVKHSYMAAAAKTIFNGSQYIVIVFAAFFIFFFHAALLRLRSKEFGLFVVIGMTPSQVRRMVFVESILLGGAAIVAGGLAGALFTKLFLLAMTNVLHLQAKIPFVIPMVSIWSTLVVFGSIFLLDGLFISWRMGRRMPTTLLLGARVSQNMPKFSKWVVLLSLVCLGAAYFQAVFQSNNVGQNFFPILILTTIGTYLLFSQVAVMVLQNLRKRPLTGISMLVVSRFAHRVKDSARVFTVVTLLTAMVLSGMGSVFGMQSMVGQNSLHISPISVMLAEQAGRPLPVDTKAVKVAFASQHVPLTAEHTTPLLVATIQRQGTSATAQAATTSSVRFPVAVLSDSEFNAMINLLREQEPELKKYLATNPSPSPGHANFYAPYPLTMGTMFPNPHIKLNLGNQQLPVQVDGQFNTRILNQQAEGILPDFMLVVSDADYANWTQIAPAGSHWHVYSFLTPNWKQTQPILNQVQQQLGQNYQRNITATVTSSSQTTQLLSVMLFVGFFISALFFLASGSMIYFRLQAQQEEDQRQFRTLQRLGMQRAEMNRVLNVEFLLLFFVPVLVALIHSLFAMTDFRHLVNIEGTAWPVFAIVVGLYVASTTIFFFIARTRHAHSVVADGK